VSSSSFISLYSSDTSEVLSVSLRLLDLLLVRDLLLELDLLLVRDLDLDDLKDPSLGRTLRDLDLLSECLSRSLRLESFAFALETCFRLFTLDLGAAAQQHFMRMQENMIMELKPTMKPR